MTLLVSYLSVFIGIKLSNCARVVTSGLVCEHLDTIELIVDENVATTTQNITYSSRDAKHALGKKVIGHWSLRSGSKKLAKVSK